MQKHIFNDHAMVFKKHNRLQSCRRFNQESYTLLSTIPPYVIFNNRLKVNKKIKTIFNIYIFNVNNALSTESDQPANIKIHKAGMWANYFSVIKEKRHTYTLYRTLDYTFIDDNIFSTGAILGSSLVSDWAVEEHIEEFSEAIECDEDIVEYSKNYYPNGIFSGVKPESYEDDGCNRTMVRFLSSKNTEIINPFKAETIYAGILSHEDKGFHILFNNGQME